MKLFSLLSALLVFFFYGSVMSIAQQANWQQFAEYTMDVYLDVDTHNFGGHQTLVYHNNSPDTLHTLYYHLYFNAFQPESMMDRRSRSIVDPDGRVRDRIYYLDESEIGMQRVHAMLQDYENIAWRIEGTVLIADLNTPILPDSSSEIDMVFSGQVPVQIRRSGRYNAEGIAYSMSQWYPRIAEYDKDGWHTHPYVAREFHGTFANFDVFISIDKNFTLGGTGYLQNPQEIGHGYENPNEPLSLPEGDELRWHFHAPNVIDFMWAAHDDFTHDIYEMENGPTLHFLYVDRPETTNWQYLDQLTAEAIRFMNNYIGEYPYDQFSVIQGGDGGMEYPMATLITGHRNLGSLVGVTVHELVHMWFQTTLATNESLHHWMDEGFTVYMSSLVMQHLFNQPGNPHAQTYMTYLRLVHDQLEENMGQHADHYHTNAAYSMASYRKGSMILHQLEYIVGADVLKRSLQRYFEKFKFMHPDPTDFRLIVEKESGMMLGWYFDTMLHSTRTIDLAIDRVRSSGENTSIRLENKSDFLMPIDLKVTLKNGNEILYHIPRHEMLETKRQETEVEQINLDSWYWTHNEYEFEIPYERSEIDRIEIDPSNRLADINRLNNTWPRPYDYRFLEPTQPNWNQYVVGYRPALWYGEKSGLRAGFRMQGSYLFNTKITDLSLQITSGNIENDFDANRIDVDYKLGFADRWRLLGPEGWWYATAERYYGINHQRIGVTKRLGEYGRLENSYVRVEMSAFHLQKTSDRLISPLSSEWQRGSLGGIETSVYFGNPDVTGIKLNGIVATFDNVWASHSVDLKANYSFFSESENFQSRWGFGFGGGSSVMASQQLFNLAQGSAIDRWSNTAYMGIANLNTDLYFDSNLVHETGTGLSGYAISGSQNSLIAANNMIYFSIWNSFRPFSTNSARAFELEFYAGTGRTWFGSFVNNFELPGEDTNWLASMGTGLTYNVNELASASRWVRQSNFLQDLKLSIRMPFYTFKPAEGNEWEARFIFSVSRGF